MCNSQTDILSDLPRWATLDRTDDGFVLSVRVWNLVCLLLFAFAMAFTAVTIGVLVGGQISMGRFSLTLVLCSIPFALASAALWYAALFFCRGRVTVTVKAGAGTVFTGLRRIGRTKRFQCSDVTELCVLERTSGWQGSRYMVNGGGIELKGLHPVTFAFPLTRKRYEVMAAALRKLLDER